MKARTRFRLVLADPPWPLRDQGTRLAPAYSGSQRASARYETMPLQAICDLGARLQPYLAEACVLALWCPHALVLEGAAKEVALAWGFRTPVQELIWEKTTEDGRTRFGGGHYFRVATEPLVIAARGKAATELVRRHDLPNIFRAPRTAHSAKPDRSYELLEQAFRGPYLELFARRRYSQKWRVWGNQAPRAGRFPL